MFLLKHRSLFICVLIVALLAISAPAALAQSNNTIVVQPGDTLARIAARNNTSIEALAAANGILNANHIMVGQRLIIPAPGTNVSATVRTYTIRHGETLRDVAYRFNTTVEAIAQANRIINPDYILPGQVINLPATGGPIIAPVIAAPTVVVTPVAPVVQPVPVSNPVVSTTRVIINGRYVVRAGDTLSEIAAYFGVDMYNIARANYILNLNRIYVGQSLRIPGR